MPIFVSRDFQNFFLYRITGVAASLELFWNIWYDYAKYGTHIIVLIIIEFDVECSLLKFSTLYRKNVWKYDYE